MIKVLKDICCYFKLKTSENSFRIGFFCENNYIFQYLEPYILKKLKREKVLILSFQNIKNNLIDKSSIFIFRTNFFRELVFLTLKLKFLYSSTPDLDKTIFKRSKFSKCKYIYLHHTPVSLTLIYNSDAFNAFDAVQTISTYQFEEMKEIVSKNNLKTKIFKSKYLFINKQIERNRSQIPDTDVLIAPSWNSSFYKLNYHILLKKQLSKNNITYKLRPHPMSLAKGEIAMNDLTKLDIPVDKLTLLNLFKYKFIITDWSGIFIEFALIFKRKAYLINTPKKIVNTNYLNYENQPIEISLRNILGKTYEIHNIQKIIDEIQILKKNRINEDENVKKILNEEFY